MESGIRRELKSRARGIEARVSIGKGGMTEAVLAEANRILTREELLKVRFVGYKDQKKELSEQLAEKTSSEVLDRIGHVVVLYRAKKK